MTVNNIGDRNEDFLSRIDQILSKAVMTMQMELREHRFHLTDASEFDEIEGSIQPLFNFLPESLAPY